MVAAQQGTNRMKNVRMVGIRSEEDEDVAGQSACEDRMDVFALLERLFEVLFQVLGPPKPVDLIPASPSNGLVNDFYHGVITLHA
jgi:hypothetical protein